MTAERTEICRDGACVVLEPVSYTHLDVYKRQALNRVVDGRLGKWTMLTSNLLPKPIGEHLDARIASRLYRVENVVCRVEDAPDDCFERYMRREGE